MQFRKVTVVVPVYQSSDSLPELFQRIERVFDGLEFELELICVDDNSGDGTWETLKKLKRSMSADVKLMRLRKNAGQHNALVAGFSQVTGDVVITMDDDLQNPPEEIPKLVAAVEEGHDIAIGSYTQKQHSPTRNLSSRLVDAVLRLMFGLRRNFKLTSFRAIHGEIIQEINQMGAVYPYVTAMVLNQSSDCVNVEVRHDARRYGTSNYDFGRSFKLIANLLLSYSNLPAIGVGLLCVMGVLFSLGLGAWVMMQLVLYGSNVPGWASTLVAISVLNSMILFCMFVFTIYISRISRQLIGSRSKFVVAEVDYD